MLDVRGLTAGYGARPVLRAISLNARGGESVALLGPNGSGKTTLLRCISGVLRPQGGDICLAGKSLERLRPRERARLAAVVPQRAECPPGLSVRHMVLLGRYPYLSWLGGYGRRDYEAVERALAATGAAGLAGRRVDELSGGELQRVLLARALAQESPLLLLDELAAGLDLARMVELFDLLERRRAAGACVLMAMHDCNLASLYATRLIGLKNGQMLFDGPASEIFTEEKLSALYDIPIRVFPHPRWGLPQALPGRAAGPWSGDSSVAACDVHASAGGGAD
ncbi:MAG: ABC transporter ATP-binding protein [Desulfovibrio sp.]|uniref:ABC transporter ATP-binding protein n=1 Tax=Desulfovibrio sp. TaxID=885 RepID=UPI00258B901F|nr:ABC transporter ATP-binding protein [Desulfovibrio sp.]MCD7984236.1 ABC transporter ATP-binding protein [Desulfovibrio sp.]